MDFFKSFDLVMNGLDNLEARRHVNRLCLAAETPLIESGTAGYLGQVKSGPTLMCHRNTYPTVAHVAKHLRASSSHARGQHDVSRLCLATETPLMQLGIASYLEQVTQQPISLLSLHSSLVFYLVQLCARHHAKMPTGYSWQQRPY